MRIHSLIAAAALLLAASVQAQQQVANAPEAPKLSAAAYILLDPLTGQVLAQHEADEKRRPASLAKMMTAYLVFEHIKAGRLKLDDTIVISPTAKRAEGHTLRLRSGAETTVRALLLGMLHRSGNDAAIALAERVGGKVEYFVEAMNRKAAELGMNTTEFLNPTGLPAKGAHSTARDLANLAVRTIEDFPQLFAVYGIADFELGGQYLRSRNPLLEKYDGADGFKTGHTYAAGYCLAATAARQDRDGMRLVAVVLGAPTESNREQDMRRLLDYGFRNWQTVKLFENAAHSIPIIGEAKVWGGDADRVDLRPDADLPLKLLLPRAQAETLALSLTIDEGLEAPLVAGATAGNLILHSGDETIAQIPAVTASAVPAGPWWKRASDFVRLHWIAPPDRRTASR